jgi:hypothetical protein
MTKIAYVEVGVSTTPRIKATEIEFDFPWHAFGGLPSSTSATASTTVDKERVESVKRSNKFLGLMQFNFRKIGLTYDSIIQ